MLAGVIDCKRSQKWGCRGRLALGEDHEVLGEEREDDAVWGVKGEDHVALEE